MMMRRPPFCVALMIASLCVVSDAFAFGPTGHRITGTIAEEYLSKKSKRAIKAIIGDESLATASTWADEMRSDPSEFWQKQAGYYHYVTVPDGKTYAQVGAPSKGDAVTALSKFRRTLRDKSASKEDKALALRFIVHIIGDLHQPLHAGNSIDKGGNKVNVIFFGEKTNLHRVWDSDLIKREKLSVAEWAQRLSSGISQSELKAWASIEPETWIAESVALRAKIYPDKRKISEAYFKQNLPHMHLRLQQAGVRMAFYLNDIFK